MKNFIKCKTHPRKNLTGQKFKRLKILQAVGKQNSSIVWECKCDCGDIILVKGSHLTTGATQSCGCLAKENAANRLNKHGLYYTTEHKTWAGMKGRCNNFNDSAYKDYGGRGITVCKRWEKFINFYEDMGKRPNGLELDRKDNNKGYSKENCHWTTKKKNCRNRRSSVILEFNGKKQSISDWADELYPTMGFTMCRISQRIRRGWSIERALTEPLN